jgi:hypothetical protein
VRWAPRPSLRGSDIELGVVVVLLVVVPVGKLAPQTLLLVAQLDALSSGLLALARIALVGVVVVVPAVVGFEIIEELGFVAFLVVLFGLTHGNPPCQSSHSTRISAPFTTV